MSEATEPSTKLNDDEANTMLAGILHGSNVEPEEKEAGDKTPAERPSPVVNYAPEENAAEEQPQPEAEQVEPESDDVVELRARLEAREKELETATKRVADIQERSRQSVELVRSRMLAKSTQLDKARQVLEKALRNEEGVDKSEVERLMAEIQSGYNPASTNFVPQQAPSAPNEDAVIGINDFLNENGISAEEAAKFGDWTRSASHTLTQRDLQLAERDAYAFMYAAWPKFAKAQEAKPAAEPSITAKAIKTVQKVQKAAARASGAAPVQSGGVDKGRPEAPDPKKLTDKELSDLMQQMGGFR